MSVCPCGGLPAGASYRECCEPALTMTAWPATAEALMRSRYTAFALGNRDHLFRTWHPSTRPADVTADSGAEWLGLTVHAVENGRADQDSGTVEFTARYIEAGRGESLHEKSSFAKRAGRWMYLEPLE